MRTYEDIHLQNEEYRARAADILTDYEADSELSSLDTFTTNPKPLPSDFDPKGGYIK